ncbi:carboxypeptidase-like regulatory domain-containing protein [Hymenobacter properus]|uniref:Carboxypeptidase-like regulatory domain-containing protein n=1 Tax=Hymenobacter properus TaxID=2791026 RepID=A0A931BL67_9BACT|nr:carboxypeptidase-like regulatory domain-containing protein [Hymenobacter properus]MBF9141490.1 carboxypeptidase-like regulatory domain-containing protein [Hymenobacter properus]MBR7720299.1 carboxypeptidase-like regulatory domain-containing protein [Microvirga sp. SRT04]
MRPATILHIPQPCHESWAAMTPAAQGRHCAACQKTVVDFTHKTDAEILALLAGAAGGRTCGRFAAGQLGRPLQRAAPAAPTVARWRTWLAAAVALWGLREGIGTDAKAQAPTEWRARYWGGPVPVAQAADMKDVAEASEPLVLKGLVLDSTTREGLPGASVLIRNSTVGVATVADGTFELRVPDEYRQYGLVVLEVRCLGYVSQELSIATSSPKPLTFKLQPDVKGMLSGEVVVVAGGVMALASPWPWHPRAFYRWSKYWLTRPFRRG